MRYKIELLTIKVLWIKVLKFQNKMTYRTIKTVWLVMLKLNNSYSFRAFKSIKAVIMPNLNVITFSDGALLWNTGYKTNS